ncbi:MAG: AraC family transcriptional regulator [Spongiibacteraceae bacterium]
MRTVQRSLTGARHQGLDCQNLMAQAGIHPSLIHLPQRRIPLHQFIDLCRLISGRLEDEQYGLLARPQKIGSYRAIAINAVHAKNLGQAMQRFTEYSNLFDNSLFLRCIGSDKSAKLQLERRPNMQVLDSFAIDIALMVLHRFASWLINERINLKKVDLDYLPDRHHEHQYLFFGAPVFGQQNHNLLEFDSAYLRRPVVQNEQSLGDYFERAPSNLYLPLEESGQLALQIRKCLSQMDETTFARYTFKQYSAEKNTSTDTLRRRLHQEGTSWQALRNTLRREQAIKYLADGRRSIEDIAFKIGYTEAAAFIRAFKQWTGLTPLQFRKQLHQH